MASTHAGSGSATIGFAALLGALGIAASCVARDKPPEPAEPIATVSQALNLTPTIGNFAVYAERSVTLGSEAHVTGGDIGIAEATAASFGPQLVIGSQATIDAANNLLSPTILLDSEAQVGDVQTNSLTNDGATIGAVAPYPASAMPAIPLAPASSSGGADVSVASQQTTTLTPGNYGALSIGSQGHVTFAAGTYSFTSVVIGSQAQIATDPAGVAIQVAGTLSLASQVQMAPSSGPAGGLVISVAGGDGPNASPPAASIGAQSVLSALLVVPRGTLSIGNDVLFTGAVAGFDVTLGAQAIVTYQSGLASTPLAQQGQSGSQPLWGYWEPNNPNYPVLGPVPPDTMVSLAIGLPVNDPDGLAMTIREVSDPASPMFHQYLTPAEFITLHGASSNNYTLLQGWATANGLTVTNTYPTNLLLDVQGPASAVAQALYVNLVYRPRSDGTQFVSTDREPSINFSAMLGHISGLNDYLPVTVAGLNGTADRGEYWGWSFRDAYLGQGATSPCFAYDGSGQTVGILAQSNFNPLDISEYQQRAMPPNAGQPYGAPTVSWFPVPGESPPDTPTAGDPNETEVLLDIDSVQSMAPGANIVVFGGYRIYDTVHVMANYAGLTVGTSSLFYQYELNAQVALAQMASVGVSFFGVSGDSGAIPDPGDFRDLDYLTLVGGTILSTSGTCNWSGEEVLDVSEPPGSACVNGGSGGGVLSGTNSTWKCYPATSCPPAGGTPIPWWQMNTNVRAAGGNPQFRNFPDVSAVAGDVAYVENDDPQTAANPYWPEIQGGGGTSVSTPLWAGFAALVNSASMSGNLGFANPAIYAIGNTGNNVGSQNIYASTFHDIDAGTNGCANGLNYPAGPGYDLATGWGSPTCNLLLQLANIVPPPSGSTSPSSSLYRHIVLSEDNNPNGVLSYTWQSNVTNDGTGGTPSGLNGGSGPFSINLGAFDITPDTVGDQTPNPPTFTSACMSTSGNWELQIVVPNLQYEQNANGPTPDVAVEAMASLLLFAASDCSGTPYAMSSMHYTVHATQDAPVPPTLTINLTATGSPDATTQVYVSVSGMIVVQNMDLCENSMGVLEPTNVMGNDPMNCGQCGLQNGMVTSGQCMGLSPNCCTGGCTIDLCPDAG